MKTYSKARLINLLLLISMFFPFAAKSETELGAVVDSNTIWRKNNIEVCWENPENHPDKIFWVKSAIARTWEANSAIRFYNWGKCARDNKGIRIKIADEHPRVLNLGRLLNGIKGGMVLNFSFKVGFQCHHDIKYCIDVIAVHEFGHALGFHHEQNRSDTGISNVGNRYIGCLQRHYQGKISNEFKIGKWDLHSVMNYCNPQWSGGGNLSKGDISAVQLLYGRNDGNGYTRYDIRKDNTDPGYPKEINQKTWTGLWNGGVDASTSWKNGVAYFFKGSEYIRYDTKQDRAASGYPKKMTKKSWPGVWTNGIDAAINWGNGKVYFFKGPQYIRYDIKADKADPGYPKNIIGKWGGIRDDGINAAINWGNGKAYFFHQK